MEGAPKAPRRPERQKERDALAHDVRDIRMERDVARAQAGSLTAKVRDFFGRENGSAALNTKAGERDAAARARMARGRRGIEERDAQFEEERFRGQVTLVFSHIDMLLEARRSGASEPFTEALAAITADAEVLDDALFWQDRSGMRPYGRQLSNKLHMALEALRSSRIPTDFERGDAMREAHHVLLDIVERNTSALANDLVPERLAEPKAAAATLLCALVEHGDESQRQRAFAAFESLDLAHEWHVPEEWPYSEVATLFLVKGDTKERARAYQVLDALYADEGMRGGLARFVGRVCLARMQEDNQAGPGPELPLLEKLVTPYGLDGQAVWRAWRHSTGEGQEIGLHMHAAFEKNMVAIEALEKQEPGIAKLLHAEYGIADFGRCPQELLLAQYREREKNDRPYGVILFPYEDHNGAFYQDDEAFRGLHEQLDGRYYLRTFECASKQDLARALITLDNKYGTEHKIAFAIVGGHGNPFSVTFGSDLAPRNSFRKWELEGGGVARAREFFEDHPTIMLASCSTGVDRGIGQQLSETFGARVIAPDVDTNINAFTVTFDDSGEPQFDVVYAAKENARKIYSNGAPITAPHSS